MFLEKIDDTNDLKKLNRKELKELANEVRAALINKISKAGGHSGPNLGMVEMTVALHYVFDSPNDKFVFDVSHQSYPHKILTGRKEAFLDEEHFHDVTGYTNPLESEHDMFTIGHTSTSVSLALGLAIGRDLNKKAENIIAIIGDGSLSGGEALEAIDYAGEYNKNLIIIVNDNDQSIAENHGGIYQTLKELRDTNGTSNNNIFTSFGLDYKYLDDGHDIEKLIELFESVKNIDHPIVLHIHTIKGKGLPYAEVNKEAWHAGGPFNVADGTYKFVDEDDQTLFNSLTNLLNANKKAIVVNAGTPMGLGFIEPVRKEYVERGQFIDVGIAEAALADTITAVQKARPIIDAQVEKASDELYTLQEVGKSVVLLDAAILLLDEAAEYLDELDQLDHISEQQAAQASILVAQAKVYANDAALHISEKLLELGGSRSSLSSHNLDQHWRNARVHTLHDPIRWKLHALGNYFLNNTLPARHAWI